MSAGFVLLLMLELSTLTKKFIVSNIDFRIICWIYYTTFSRQFYTVVHPTTDIRLRHGIATSFDKWYCLQARDLLCGVWYLVGMEEAELLPNQVF